MICEQQTYKLLYPLSISISKLIIWNLDWTYAEYVALGFAK
jgi:hypothetical protein